MNDAQAARDRGVARTALNNSKWLEDGLRLLGGRLPGEEATGEMIRFYLRRNGLAEPTSPHAWGALIRTAIRRGVIADTGRSMQMVAEKSHARRTPIWRFL